METCYIRNQNAYIEVFIQEVDSPIGMRGEKHYDGWAEYIEEFEDEPSHIYENREDFFRAYRNRNITIREY